MTEAQLKESVAAAWWNNMDQSTRALALNTMYRWGMANSRRIARTSYSRLGSSDRYSVRCACPL